MKICFIADNIDRKAGLGRMVCSIADQLKKRGHEIGFVVSSGVTDHDLLKVSFRFFKFRPYKNLIDLVRIRKFVKNYDVIVCFDVQPAGILAHLATIGRSDVIVVHSLGTYSLFLPNTGVKNFFIKKVFDMSNRVFLINDFVKRKIEESRPGFRFGSNTTFVPVGVDTKLFYKRESMSNVCIDDYIISVGAIKPRKGQLESVKAFHSISKRYPDLFFVIVGSQTDSSSYYRRVKKYVKENKLNQRTIFLEGIDDQTLINLYNGAKFFVLTPVSTRRTIEGFGMVYIESALCGITSIGTFDTGAEAAIVDGETGCLVECSQTEIAKAMITLIDDKELCARYAHNAIQRARTFDWSFVVDLYESELNDIFASKK